MMKNLVEIEKGLKRMKDHMSHIFDGIYSGDMDFLGDEFDFKQPEADVYETKDKVVCKFDLPGIDKNEIELEIKDGFIVLKAEKNINIEDEDKKLGTHKIERSHKGYYRRFMLPSAVDEDSVKADYSNGTLNVEIKKDESKNVSKKLIKID